MYPSSSCQNILNRNFRQLSQTLRKNGLRDPDKPTMTTAHLDQDQPPLAYGRSRRRRAEGEAYHQAVILVADAERLEATLGQAVAGRSPADFDLCECHRLSVQLRGHATRLKRDLDILTGRVPGPMAPGGGGNWARSEAHTLVRRIAVGASRLSYLAGRMEGGRPAMGAIARRLAQGADQLGHYLGDGTGPAVSRDTNRE